MVSEVREEEAGRNLRRNIFEKVLREQSGTKIALAHHKNDNVETFLWNLCRGTGLKGLGGILPVNGKYIRPLLCLKREDIEKVPELIRTIGFDDESTIVHYLNPVYQNIVREKYN